MANPSEPRWYFNPARVVRLAPVVFAIHVAEEAPGYVDWFNSIVSPGISQRSFLTVNAVAFVITALAAAATSRAALLAAAGWLSFLMFANAILHLTGAIVHDRYCPGVVTATVFYLPYFTWFMLLVRKQFAVSAPGLAAIILLAGTPMFVHGYLIVFKGSRLF